MNIRDTIDFLERLVLENVSDKTIWSSVSLKRIVKPILLYMGRDYYPPIWFYVGIKRDYVIVPRIYCSCKSFTINVMTRNRKKVCRHLVIQHIAEKMGLYRVVEIDDPDTYIRIIWEILDIERSPLLRKLLHK